MGVELPVGVVVLEAVEAVVLEGEGVEEGVGVLIKDHQIK